MKKFNLILAVLLYSSSLSFAATSSVERDPANAVGSSYYNNGLTLGVTSPDIVFGDANSLGAGSVGGNVIFGGGSATYPNQITDTGGVTFFGLSSIWGSYDNIFNGSTGAIIGPHNRIGIGGQSSETFFWGSSNEAGTISSSGTTVTGVGTSFQNTMKKGSYILADGQERIVDTITSATSLTTTVAFSPTLSGNTYKKSNWMTPNSAYTPTDSNNHSWAIGSSNMIFNSAYAIAAGTQNTIGWDGTTQRASTSASTWGGLGNNVAGPYSTTVGGQLNTIFSPAGAGHNTIIGGSTNNITAGGWSTVGGQSSSSGANHNFTHGFSINNNGTRTAAFGSTYTSTMTDSLIFGNGFSTATGTYSLLGGLASTNNASDYSGTLGYIVQNAADYSWGWGRENLLTSGATWASAGGYKSRVNKPGQQAQAAGVFTSVGDAQTSQMVARKATTDATPTVMTLDGAALASTNAITVNSTSTGTYSATAYEVTVIAMKQGSTADFGRWKFEGIITKGSNAVSTTKQTGEVAATPQLLGTASSTPWACATSADTTNGALSITVTGQSATNINWVANVRLTEVTYV